MKRNLTRWVKQANARKQVSSSQQCSRCYGSETGAGAGNYDVDARAACKDDADALSTAMAKLLSVLASPTQTKAWKAALLYMCVFFPWKRFLQDISRLWFGLVMLGPAAALPGPYVRCVLPACEDEEDAAPV